MPFQKQFSRIQIARLMRERVKLYPDEPRMEAYRQVAAAVGCQPRLVRKVMKLTRRSFQRGRPWPATLSTLALNLRAEGHTAEEIGKRVGKTTQAVRRKFARMTNLPETKYRGKSRQHALIFDLLIAGVPIDLTAAKVGMTPKSVRRLKNSPQYQNWKERYARY